MPNIIAYVGESSQQFLRWAYIHGNECEGLKRRREAEATLFATPDVQPST